MFKVTAQYLKSFLSLSFLWESTPSLMDSAVSTIIHLPHCSSGLDFEGEDRYWFVDVLADRMRQKGIQRYVKIKHEL